jgi:hypothetical protein
VSTCEVSWEIVLKKIQQWFLHHVKSLGVDFIGIESALGSTS